MGRAGRYDVVLGFGMADGNNAGVRAQQAQAQESAEGCSRPSDSQRAGRRREELEKRGLQHLYVDGGATVQRFLPPD